MSRILMLVAVLTVAGCTFSRPVPSEEIIGRWSGEIGGYPVEVAYDESAVTVTGSGPVPYRLNGDELTFEGGGSQVRIVSFPSANEMVQSDPMTGTQHVFTRIN